MRIAVPGEIKEREYRVALTPAGAGELSRDGHTVLVQAGAGVGSGFSDKAYRAAGAQVVPEVERVWGEAELLLKVKEPIASEYAWLRDDLVLFTFLHLAADWELTRAILDSGVTAVAYETVRGADGGLPLLAPMSEVAGKLAVQVGAYHLMSPLGGGGVLLGGVPGVRPGRVVVLGGGTVGTQAAGLAAGMGAQVEVLDTNPVRLARLDERFAGRVVTIASNAAEVRRAVVGADLVIGSVLIPGARAPKLVIDEMVAAMRPGAVLVDVAIDQGGCFASSRPTTHDQPTFAVADALFYCVANMPGAVPHTATIALTNATLPYIRTIAAHGWPAARREDPLLAQGLAAAGGELFSQEVARAHGSVLGIGA